MIEIEIVVEFEFGILCMHVHHKKKKARRLKRQRALFSFFVQPPFPRPVLSLQRLTQQIVVQLHA